MDTLVELARLISSGDSAVMNDVSACAEDPKGWFEAHQERYEERGMDCADDLDSVRWLGLADILEEHGWVCERDWKDELEDFLYFVENLKGFQAQKLSIDPEWFDKDGDIPAWCGILKEKWAAQGVRMAAIGIDSDSYVLFPFPAASFPALQELAGKTGRCIDFVDDM